MIWDVAEAYIFANIALFVAAVLVAGTLGLLQAFHLKFGDPEP